MNGQTGESGRVFSPLPFDGDAGLPQSFPFVFGGQTYRFSIYADVAAGLVRGQADFIDLPSMTAFLVVRVEAERADGVSDVIFLRKVVPELEYEAGGIALRFRQQHLALKNLNGRGNFGSQITGEIAARWA